MAAKKARPPVTVGDVFEDKDTRVGRRVLRVSKLTSGRAECAIEGTGRSTTISVRNLQERYRLVTPEEHA